MKVPIILKSSKMIQLTRAPSTILLIWVAAVFASLTETSAFTMRLPTSATFFSQVPQVRTTTLIAVSEESKNSEIAKEVQELLARAKAIRESLPPEEPIITIKPESSSETAEQFESSSSSFNNNNEEKKSSVGYRLYFDIGREDGTWMDPTWGRSGNRIEGSLDVFFQSPPNHDGIDESLADPDIISKMVKDNLSGQSTAVRVLESSPNARLRGGFDKMPCYGGGYRLDISKRAATVRFFLEVDGTEDGRGNYGDIFVPKGCLYFSLPCFNNSVNQLSSKEGIITVRQMGWHTGWRREESRIVGVFRAVPIEQARKKDKY